MFIFTNLQFRVLNRIRENYLPFPSNFKVKSRTTKEEVQIIHSYCVAKKIMQHSESTFTTVLVL